MKILLAVDKSDFSEAAVDAVVAEFAPSKTEVRVLHAVDWEARLPPSLSFVPGPDAAHEMLGIRDALIQDAESYVQSIAGRLRVAGFNAASEVRSTGDARLAILDAAAAWPADLIVLGSHGRSGLDRFLLGSVSEGVVRHATCSVQVVRRPRAAASRPSERAS